MARPGKSTYVCSACGGRSLKWQGQCPDCNAWNTLEEHAPAAPRRGVGGVRPVELSALSSDAVDRHATGFAEFDRVLGGGVVPGAVILLGGDPGVGKSTLLQQVAAALPAELAVCYATGEESLRQVAQRS
ncbi:MAG TPA: DNA repair protein RadA, partial [Woeseiaceae bacterium]|nr:DNA repair protein RadA [Woeseiaceae bacterium]